MVSPPDSTFVFAMFFGARVFYLAHMICYLHSCHHSRTHSNKGLPTCFLRVLAAQSNPLDRQLVQLRHEGIVKSTDVTFNVGLVEGYILEFEKSPTLKYLSEVVDKQRFERKTRTARRKPHIRNDKSQKRKRACVESDFEKQISANIT